MMPYRRDQPLIYTVLSRDNIEEIARATRIPIVKLAEMFNKAAKYGNAVVFWEAERRWWTVVVDGEYVYNGLLVEVIQEAMRRPG